MGIDNLWDILKPVKTEKKIEEFKGKKLAVDFSSWFVPCSQTKKPNRAIFFKILHLLKNGITPIYVLDSKEPIAIKKRQRDHTFFEESSQWEILFEALGIPFIRSCGEAEKTCSKLNESRVVDGCMTDDGDAFAYGATTILKGYQVKKNLDVYHLPATVVHETDEVHLSRGHIIAAAILIGCGYCKGLTSVGPNTFLKLMSELKVNEIEDVLDRIQSWKGNEQLNTAQNIIKEGKKPGFCSKCYHSGMWREHKKNGCQVCDTQKRCNENEDICKFAVELKVRELALLKSDFPNEEQRKAVNEYSKEDDTIVDEEDVKMKHPNFYQAENLLKEEFELSKSDVKQMYPAFIKMFLHGAGPDLGINPLEVIKEKTKLCNVLFKMDIKETKDEHKENNDESERHCCKVEVEVTKDLFDAKFPGWLKKKEIKPKTKKQREQRQETATTSKVVKRTEARNSNSI